MTIIILSILAGLILLFTLSSVRLKFRYNDQSKYLKVSFWFLAVTLYPLAKEGRFSLAGISIKQFNLRSQKTPSSAPAVKKKSKSSFTWRSIWEIVREERFRKILTFPKRIRIKYLDIDISGGLSNPCQTGIALGAFYALKGMMPKIMRYVSYRPDFLSSRLKFEGKGLVYLRIYHILVLAYYLLMIKVRSYWREKALEKKKGAAYAQ